jgi:hypothetical protein
VALTKEAQERTDLQWALDKHHYKDPRTGEWMVTSATRVAKAYADGDLIGAAAGAAVKLVKMGIDYRREWNDRMWRGKRLHDYVSNWAMGKTADVDERDDAHLDAFLAFCDATHPHWLATERIAVSARGCGGRLDLIGEFEYPEGTRDFWLVDLKSGRPHLHELILQLAGYASMDGLVVFDEKGTATDLEPMPYFTRWGGLYLDGRGKATLVEVPKLGGDETRADAQAKAIASFNHLLEVRRWADALPKEDRQ